MTTRRLNRTEIAAIVGDDPRAIRAFERLLSDVQANISGPSNIVLNYNSDGTLADPLPAVTTFQLIPEGDVAFSNGVSWGVTVLSGEFDGSPPTIGGTGAGALFINSGITSPVVTLGITARVSGRGYPPLTVTVTRSTAPTEGGSGGGTASDSTSSLTALGLTTFVPITRELLITLPASVTEATLTAASIALRLPAALPDGTTVVEAKWQRESAPSVWSDVGVTSTSSPSPFVEDLSEPGTPIFVATAGAITCNRTETGMVAGSAQKFRLVARVSSGNVRTVTPSGTASVMA